MQLFDMDGTIFDSTDAIVKHWRQLGKEIGVDGDGEFHLQVTLVTNRSDYLLVILQTSHGRRSVDVLAIHAPHLANWDRKFSTTLTQSPNAVN